MAGILLPEKAGSTAVEQQLKDSLYYSQQWLDLLTTLYGYHVTSLTSKGPQGEITGFLPLATIHSALRGRRLVALPFSDYCPLLAEDDATANHLVDQAIRMAQQEGARYLELRTGPNSILAKRSDLTEVDLYTRWLLVLDSDPHVVWSGLRKPIQRQVEKSRKLGVQVRLAERHEEILHYHRLHLRTRTKKHGMPTQPERFFLALWDAFAAKGSLQVLLAEYEGAIVAGMILLASGTTIRYAYGASDDSYLHLAPNNLLMWKAISWACEHGYRTFDLGRTARDNRGLMEFKRRWGATMEPLPYYYFPHAAGLAATSETSWRFKALTSCWKQLPLPIAEFLSGHLYKHLG